MHPGLIVFGGALVAGWAWLLSRPKKAAFIDAWTGERVQKGPWFYLPDGSRYRILSAEHHVGSYKTGGWYVEIEAETKSPACAEGETYNTTSTLGPLWTRWSRKLGWHAVIPT